MEKNYIRIILGCSIVCLLISLLGCNMQPQVYSVAFDTGEGSTVDSQLVQENKKATKPTVNPTKVGYAFDNWCTDDTFATVWDFDTPITKDIILYAKWTADTYVVTYNANEATGGTVPANQTKTHGVNVTLATNTGNLAQTGYSFDGWNTQSDGAGTAYAEGSSYTANAVATLYAKWTVNKYSVTFDSDGGTAVADLELDFGAAITAPASPTKAGHAFGGWDPALPATMPVDGFSTKAKWTVNKYSVTFDSDGGTAVADLELDFGAAITAPASPTKAGHAFGGWDPALPATMPVDGFSTKAKWTVNKYSVTFDSDGGTAVADLELDFGAAITVPAAPTKAGHAFGGWDPALPATMPVDGFSTKAKWTADTYAVTYNANEATSGGVPSVQTKTHEVELTLASNTGNLARTGYSFAGWNTKADGTGTSYAEGSSYAANTGVTLYAKWIADTYAVTYNSNEATTGMVPSVQTKTHGVVLILASNTGNLARTGYSFDGWNTQADGLGTDYETESSYTANEEVTLYAKWTADTYAVTYNANEATSGTVPSDQTKTHGVNLILASNSGNLARTGYSFDGWNTQRDGLGDSYAEGSSYTANTGVTLYAKWIADTYAVTYNSNEATTGMVPSVQTKTHGVVLILASNTGNLARTGYSFDGWNTKSDGTGANYAEGSPYTDNAEITLYAKWTATEQTLRFNANGGSGSLDEEIIKTDETITLPANAFSKAGYTFAGWATTNTGDVEYADQDSYTMDSSDATLYAKWIANKNTLSFDANAGSGSMDSQTVNTGETITLPANIFTKAGYTFAGWAKSSAGSVEYADQDSYTMDSSDVTLYAKWRELTIRDIGPSGGYIFYDKGEYTNGWRYLEAAPYGWYEGVTDSYGAYSGDDDPHFQWGARGYRVEPPATATAVGGGKTNTANIVSYHDSLGTLYSEKGDYYANPKEYHVNNDGTVAAKVCADYRGGGYDDWFLPSKDELNLMCENLYEELPKLGGFFTDYYWSSSKDGYVAWAQSFKYMYQSTNNVSYESSVRPVRAF